MVGVDWPMKALSMHIQKPYKGIIVKVLIAVILSYFFFFNQTPSCICSMCYIVKAKYQIAPLKAVVGVDRPMKHNLCIYKSLIRKNGQSSYSCHFVKKKKKLNQTPSCICSMSLHCIGKVSKCSIKSCGRS